jgi:hypothetical protein
MPKLGALRHMHLDFEDLHAIVFPMPDLNALLVTRKSRARRSQNCRLYNPPAGKRRYDPCIVNAFAVSMIRLWIASDIKKKEMANNPKNSVLLFFCANSISSAKPTRALQTVYPRASLSLPPSHIF